MSASREALMNAVNGNTLPMSDKGCGSIVTGNNASENTIKRPET